jgi:hypothetical protein
MLDHPKVLAAVRAQIRILENELALSERDAVGSVSDRQDLHVRLRELKIRAGLLPRIVGSRT